MNAAAVILAAGGSSRMGVPKQTLAYGSTTLLRLAVTGALGAGCEPVVVVVGAERKLISAHLNGLTICLIDNPLWQQGLGSSIRTGIEALLTFAVDAAVILLSDQPLVCAGHIRNLVEAAETQQASIVASRYAGTLGVPALFKKNVFPLLLAIQPSEGAKALFHHPDYPTLEIPLPEAEQDIDTPEDYRRALYLADLEKEQP